MPGGWRRCRPACGPSKAAAAGLIVLDLSAIPDLSSADLGVLVALGQVVAGGRGRLRLAAVSDDSRRALEIARLANQLPVFADVRAAPGS